MKTTAATLIAGSMTLLALSGAALAQSGAASPAAPGAQAAPATPAAKPVEPAKPMATTTDPAKMAVPKAKTVTGEVIAVDVAAKTLTVKHAVNGKNEEMIIGAGEKTAEILGTLKAGDQVRVAYAGVDGKFMASTIAKVAKKK